MKPSYRVAVAVVLVVCVAVIIYFRPKNKPEAAPDATNVALTDGGAGAGAELGTSGSMFDSATPGGQPSHDLVAGPGPNGGTQTLVFDGNPRTLQPQAQPGTAGLRQSSPTLSVAAPEADANLRTYKVVRGDTVEIIAKRLYGSRSRWHEIAEANPLLDPKRLKIGQILKVPSGSATVGNSEPAHAAVEVGTAKSVTGGTAYTVRSSDTLSSISRHFYNDANRWRVIYDANRGVISNPNRLKAGVKLVIPAES